MEQMLKVMQDKLEKMDKRSERIENKIDKFQMELDDTKNKVKVVERENANLKIQLNDHEMKIEILEREVRKKRIIIQGLAESDKEHQLELEEKVRVLLRDLEVQINIENEIQEIARIGYKKVNEQNKIRPVLIELGKLSKKWEILKAAKKLKGKPIWINEDYSTVVQKQRKILISQMKKEREAGKKAFVRFNKLIVEGVSFTADQLMKPTANNNNENKSKKGRTVSERSPEMKGEDNDEQMHKMTKN